MEQALSGLTFQYPIHERMSGLRCWYVEHHLGRPSLAGPFMSSMNW